MLKHKNAIPIGASEAPASEISKRGIGPGAVIISLTKIASREKAISVLDLKAYPVVVI